MAGLRWLPEIIRSRPARPLDYSYRVPAAAQLGDPIGQMAEALNRCEVQNWAREQMTWELIFPWRTMVYGVIPRDVDESATVHLTRESETWELRLQCLPLQSHGAHAAGAGGVAVMAVALWLIGGWTTGLLPGLATALAGGLLADVTRVTALGALDRQLRMLTEDLGLELWPGIPAELHPPLPAPRR